MASASKGPVYGYYTQADDAAQYLKENTKTQLGGNFWNQQYHAVDSNVSATNAELTLGETAANQKLMNNYSKNVADATQAAYEASRHTENNVFGVKQSDINGEINDVLNSAYEQYRQQYLSDSSDVSQQYENARNQYANYFQKQYDALDTALAGEGKNLAKYQNAVPQYIAAHWEDLMSHPEFSKIMQEIGDGNIPTAGQISEYMYDENGMTPYGEVLYQYVTANTDMNIESFGSWLATQDQDLVNWAASAGYDQSGKTMAQMARESTGLDPDNVGYNEAEYYMKDYYTPEQFNDIFEQYSKSENGNNYKELLSKLNQTGTAEKRKEFVKKYNEGIKNSVKGGIELDTDTSGNIIVKAPNPGMSYDDAVIKISEFKTADEIYNKLDKKAVGGAGTKNGKQVQSMKNWYQDILDGKVKNGTTIDLDYGLGQKWYTYYNGAIYEGHGSESGDYIYIDKNYTEMHTGNWLEDAWNQAKKSVKDWWNNLWS